MRRSLSDNITAREILVGAGFIAVLVSAVLISYGANRGLPFVPTYRISAEVPDAQELVRADQVRLGGARVGVVSDVQAVPRKGRRPAYARLELALQKDLQPLPVDTQVQVRPGSILGGKYLAIFRGRSPRGVPQHGTLPLPQGRSVTDLDEAFRVFDDRTTRGVRGAVTELGDAVAGRGTTGSQTLAATRRLLPPGERVLRGLVSRRTNLARFIHGAAATTGALAGVSTQLGALVGDAATTLAAVDAAGSSLGEGIEETPPTEAVATRALIRLTPLLATGAALSRELLPAAHLIPNANRHLALALEAGRTALRHRTHGVLDPLLRSFDRLARDPASIGTIRVLTEGSKSLKPTLDFLDPVQRTCNAFGQFGRNVPSTLSEGDANGSWVRLTPIAGTGQIFQRAQPSPDLHLNFYPNETRTECEAGNEPFQPGQHIGNPPGNQGTASDKTSPPPGVSP
jgi:phospholipid/cholesterol/gamma-HCH transport system substrate-binding protein